MALEPQQDQLRITDKNSLKQWFKRGLKPLEAHFWAWLDSFWHKNDKLPISSISNLGTTLDTKANVGHIHIEYTTPDAVQQMIDSRVSSLYRLMSPVATYADLPMDGNLNGDVRNVLNTGMNYVWDGSEWDALGGLLDLSNYVNQLQFASALRDMATQTWVNQQLANVSVDLSNYYTAEDVDWRIGQAVLGFATEAWVNEQIGRIVSGGSMDLSIYATNDATSLSADNIEAWRNALRVEDVEYKNIYNSNGTLTSNRTVNLGGFTLTFNNGNVKSNRYTYNSQIDNLTPNSTWTDGVDLWFTNNAGVSKRVGSNTIITAEFNPPTLAQLTSFNIKAGDFYHCSANGQRSLFDGQQLVEWACSTSDYNALSQAQLNAIKNINITV